MRWHFGGNLQPVRMICEYDWKECPIAVVSYIWSEIVTDVVEGLTGEGQLWRLLAIMALCSMLLHTVYYKMRWVNQSEHDSTKDHLMKVGYRMHDLELKINILTYKMQYGIWPLPHEIPKPSLNQLQNVKLTLSNTSRQNMWSKHHLHGFRSKCMQNSEDDRSMNEQSFANEQMKLAHQNFWSQFEDRKSDSDTTNPRKLKLLHGETVCENYQRLLQTADECRKYIDEINESNKSLGWFENSTDMSDHNCIETESEKNYHRYLVDPKKWHGIQKYRNGELRKLNEGDSTTSDQTTSPFNLKHKCAVDNERYIEERSENKSRLLPPGLSITFLSDKFKTLPTNERSMKIADGKKIQSKDSTNETLNKVKEKLESLDDIGHNGKRLKFLYTADTDIENKAKSHNINGEYEKMSTTLSSRSGNGSKLVENSSMPIKEQSWSATRNLNSLSEHTDMLKNTSRSSCNLGNNAITPNDKVSIANPSEKSITKEMNKHSKTPLPNTLGEDNLSLKTNSDEAVKQNSTCVQKNIMNLQEKSSLCKKKPIESIKNPSMNMVSNSKSLKNNINVTSDISTDSIQRMSTTYVMSPKQRAVDQIPMDTDEDQILLSQTSSHTELSKDSDTDDKSTTTLLREALQFKKALLMQIQKEGEIDNSTGLKNESSEYDSDVSSRSKTDNRFRSKLLDIISEEQSAGSSTEKTSGTYILTRAINRTNLHEKFDDTSNKDTNVAPLNCANIELNEECYGDVKRLVTAISSEYFSITNISDSKQSNAQKLNQGIADEDGLREQQKEYVSQKLEGKLKSDGIDDDEINIISKNINEQSRNRAGTEENLFPGNKSDSVLKKSQDIKKVKNPVEGMNRLQLLQRNDESSVDYSLALNRSQRQTEKTEDIDKVIAQVREQQNDTLENIETHVNSIAGNMTANSGTRIKFFRNLSSVDSEKAISWNSMSESSSNESIAHFVNTLINIDSKNIDTVAKQKLMMRDSTDYEGRNVATAGEELQYMFDFRNKQPQNLVTISGVNVSAKNEDDIVEKISKMIADPAIFKQQKLEAQVKISPSDSSSLKSGQEKLQRKLDISSKLKTLNAFTKPLDISECNAENNDNDEDSSPLTGRTVVYTTNVQPEKNVSQIEPRKQENLVDAKHNSDEVNGNPLKLGPETTSEIGNDTDPARISNFTRKETISHLKMDRLTKSSTTNFSTDTSESYFDVSNHDFAVSSIILTSQNSNLADKRNNKPVRSDMSSLYVDASDHSSKLGTNLTPDNTTTNLSPKQNCRSESQLINSHVSTSREFTVSPTKIPKKDVKIRDGPDSKDDSLIKTRRIPKSTSSLLMNDQKSKLHTEKVGILTRRSLSLEQGRLRTRAVTKDRLCGHSSCSLNDGASECDSKVISALPKSRALSKSSIPILKSRKDVSGRDKSMEPEARSQSPPHKLSTPRVKHGKSTSQMEATNNNVQNENDTGQSLHGSRKSLNRKESYTVPSKNNDTKEELSRSRPEPAENTDCRAMKSLSKELAVTPEKCNLLSTSGHLTKECTVIYINIISDGDKNELQGASAEELIKYVNDKHLIPGDRKLSPLSLKYSTSNESDGTQVVDSASPRLNTQVYKNSEDSQKNKINKSRTTATASLDIKEKVPKTLGVLGSTEISAPSETTANKLLSTSTLQLSNPLKVEKREIEVSATPSVKDTSTSVSDFPDATEGEKHLTYNPKNEVFNVPKEMVQKEQIVLSELLAGDPDFFECKKTHRFYNKLGLGFQEQPEQC